LPEEYDKVRIMLQERRNSESDIEDFKKFSNEIPKLKVPEM
jgi:hypothetical protein